jgi:hypothetical protein
MSKSIRTEAGCAVIKALVGRVEFNGRSMLPHEAYQVSHALKGAADDALMNGAREFGALVAADEMALEQLP